jgi:hypothetical protein
MTLEEERIKKMLEEIELEDSILKSLNEHFSFYYYRLETIAKHYRRKAPVRDLTFQGEFRDTVAKLSKLADNSRDFWSEMRMYYYGKDKARFVPENRLNLKQIKAAALSFNRQVDELYTVFKNLSAEGKDLPLRLNWWLLETSVNDLSKITSNILFLVRDMEKYYE